MIPHQNKLDLRERKVTEFKTENLFFLGSKLKVKCSDTALYTDNFDVISRNLSLIRKVMYTGSHMPIPNQLKNILQFNGMKLNGGENIVVSIVDDNGNHKETKIFENRSKK